MCTCLCNGIHVTFNFRNMVVISLLGICYLCFANNESSYLHKKWFVVYFLIIEGYIAKLIMHFQYFLFQNKGNSLLT